MPRSVIEWNEVFFSFASHSFRIRNTRETIEWKKMLLPVFFVRAKSYSLTQITSMVHGIIFQQEEVGRIPPFDAPKLNETFELHSKI